MPSMPVDATEHVVCECGRHRYSFGEFRWYDLTDDGEVVRPDGQPLACFKSARILSRIAKAAGFE
jgi:hypothetical protein